MTDIFGPNSTASLPPSDLSQCLANKLRAKTALLGSTLFALTWKQRVTPSGRSIPALRASGRRTSGSDSISSRTGWRTPTLGAINADRAKDPEYMNRKLAKG